jgi:hypothetical protein
MSGADTMKRLAIIGFISALFFPLYGCGINPVDNSSGIVNNPPVIISMTATPESVDAGESVELVCEASDDNGDAINFSWYCESGMFSATTGSSVSWTAPSAAGSYFIVVMISDSKATISGFVSVEVVSVGGGDGDEHDDEDEGGGGGGWTEITAAPADLIISSITDFGANIRWGSVTGALGYKVSYGTDPDAANVGEFTISSNSYDLPFLNEDTTYFAKVQAFNYAGKSAYSSIVSFETL